MKQFEEFSDVCRRAIDKYRTEFPPDLRVGALSPEFKNNPNFGTIFKIGVEQGIAWGYFRAYLMALGVSRLESYEAVSFAEAHNFWVKE